MDVVVTLPKSFGLKKWIQEGDPAGHTSWSGIEWGWFMKGHPPKKLKPGDRVYVVYNGHLIGYAHLVRVRIFSDGKGFALVRRGDAVAVTIDEKIKGFQGYRYRWWRYGDERPFPEWKLLAE